MAQLELTYGGWNYDRTEAIFSGEVRPSGYSLVPVAMRTEEVFRRSLQRQEFDVTELSASSYIMQRARGDTTFTALPVFVSRAFRHRSIYVRADSGIRSPADLEGRRVGVPEYQTTVSLWLRGILQDRHGVDFTRIYWLTGGVNAPGRRERLPLTLPDRMSVTPIGDEDTLSSLLSSGAIDACFAPNPPACFVKEPELVKRLFPDYVAEEAAYFRATGFFPIMHLIAIRTEVAERHPWLADSLFDAFVKAKAIARRRLEEAARRPANQFLLPWLLAELERTEALMGPDLWRYGLEANRAELETMCRYSLEQFLAPTLVDVDSLFAPSTRSLVDDPAAAEPAVA
jgi:4,5-dihydroxyphthalate decarboxylase